MPRVTEAISRFLAAKLSAHPGYDLLERYLSFGGPAAIETQVNVAAGKGEPVEGRRATWTDGVDTWWNIRIPKNANANPEWKDYELRYAPELHVEGVGSTGWDWKSRCSRWVGFDFDSITGHAKGVGITDEELQQVFEAAKAIPYVETRRSTGGKGGHLYVYFDEAGIPTANHTEHAALARCVLGMMSNEAGFDFASQVDCCGGVMWLWHRKMTLENQGLALVKPATRVLAVADLPINWRDHIEVITRKRAKIRIKGLSEEAQDPFEALASARRIIPLDAKHKAVIQALTESGYSTIWVTDHHLLQTHTYALKGLLENPESRQALGLIGIFDTTSQGRDKGTPNCFLFPMLNGSWKVYRFSQGISEAPSWTQDGEGWTTCYFNRVPDFVTACKSHGGVEDPEKGDWVFSRADKAIKAAEALGQKIDIDPAMFGREVRLKLSRDNRLIISVARDDSDTQDQMPGWLAKKDKWIRKYEKKLEDNPDDELGLNDYDAILRTLVTPAGDSAGWVCRLENGSWSRQPSSHIKMMLQHLGMDKNTAEAVMGGAVMRAWTLVNLPFREEYPGGRQWNLDAPQFRYKPAELADDEAPCHPHWDMILNHIGSDLDAPLKRLPWAQEAGIRTGGQYLTAWIACMVRDPFEPLPYLFTYGSENCGKSIFHEAISLLLTKGVVPADRALASRNDFNGELANAILCTVEERDLSKADSAHTRIKDWVTSRTLSIRKMRTDSYTQPNTTHWFQAANQQDFCPVFKNDTRIIVLNVPDLLPEQEVPKQRLIEKLCEESPHFMHTLMRMQLPPATGRLRLPVVATENKRRSEEMNHNELEQFLAEECFWAPGEIVPFSDFYARFSEWLPSEATFLWSKIKVVRSMPPKYPTWNGRGNKKLIGNVSFEPVTPAPDAKPIILVDGKAVVEGQEEG
jgi:hypothetical protein